VLNEFDSRVRVAAFRFLEAQVRAAGSDVLPRSVLAQGFNLDGKRVPLVGPQGIFKPAVLSTIPLMTGPGASVHYEGEAAAVIVTRCA